MDGKFGVAIPLALRLFLQIAKAVRHVHEQGLIHRDLKPQNCFMDDSGNVKVGDFGLSRESADSKEGDTMIASTMSLSVSSLPSGGQHGDDHTAGVGTRAYASPEQMSGFDYDSSTDVRYVMKRIPVEDVTDSLTHAFLLGCAILVFRYTLLVLCCLNWCIPCIRVWSAIFA